LQEMLAIREEELESLKEKYDNAET